MAFVLDVNAPVWREHLNLTVSGRPGLAPVIKGNGYGFGRDLLASEADALGVDMIAVGTSHEAESAVEHFAGDVQILTPWRSFLHTAPHPRVIHTVSRIEDLDELARIAPGSKIVLDFETSMKRHGFQASQLGLITSHLADLELIGSAIHLPMQGNNSAEARHWAQLLSASDLPSDVLFVSHLTPQELEHLASEFTTLQFRPRVGTQLWLGRPTALTVKARVLDAHSVRRGERVGYRQVRVRTSGTLAIIAGGTAHGLGLEAPRHAGSMKDRIKEVAKGLLMAINRYKSPFRVAGKQRWFVEPPHMQSSLILIPDSNTAPAIGDTVSATVRYTTTQFDAVNLNVD